MKKPVRIAITGASGNIGYAITFRIAAGDMLGHDQPIILQLFDLPRSYERLQGLTMELEDCAFPLLDSVIISSDINVAFKDADYVFLAGSRPRSAGMERKDLLEANGNIFGPQGKSINDNASREVKVLVVGNPANTNCLIAMQAAPDLSPQQFSAMTRLDHNRAQAILAEKAQAYPHQISNVTIWGNHSSTQFPDISKATIKGKPASEFIDESWYKNEFIAAVQQRGAAIIAKRGASSAASAANAAIVHMRDWALGTQDREWVSMAVLSDGSYGISKDIVFSFPVHCKDGKYEIVQGLELSEFAKEKLKTTEQELLEERQAVQALLR